MNNHRRLFLTVCLPQILSLFGLFAAGQPAVGQPAAVPPPAEQRGADCVRPQYASDMLVCDDPALRAIDADVESLARQLPPLASGAVWEEQPAWMRRRSRCAFQADHRACLIAAYADRRAVLIAAAQPASRPLRCDAVWRGRNLEVSGPDAGDALVIRENGLVLAVATVPAAGWQPWLGLDRAGNRITLRTQAGARMRCRAR